MSALLELEQDLFDLLKPKTIDDYLGLEELANQFCGSLILNYFSNQGIVIKTGSVYEIAKLELLLKIASQHHRMFLFFIHVLKELNFIIVKDQTIEFTHVSEKVKESELIHKKIQSLYPDFNVFFSFLYQCTKKYPGVLEGKLNPAQALFPTGDSSMLEKVYANTPKIGFEDLYLHLLSDTLQKEFEKFGNKKIRIIEIGAGQGILTDVLLPYMSMYNVEYVFTDIGKMFLKQAQNKYSAAEYPFLSFKQLDASQNPLEQQWTAEEADFVVGFNVLHATADISKTLKEVSKLIHANGSMLFVENIKQQFWIDMIYGLTEGWWNFDDNMRTISPLLDYQQWQSLLASMSFKSSQIFPVKDHFIKKTDSALIVIEK